VGGNTREEKDRVPRIFDEPIHSLERKGKDNISVQMYFFLPVEEGRRKWVKPTNEKVLKRIHRERCTTKEKQERKKKKEKKQDKKTPV